VIAAETTVIAAVETTTVETTTVEATAVKAGGDYLTRHCRGRVRYLCRRRFRCGRWRRSDGERSSACSQNRCDVGQYHSHNRTFMMAGQLAFDQPAFVSCNSRVAHS